MNNLLTIPEVAERLRIGRTLAYTLARRGELPVVRFGKLVRVPADRLEEWLARRVEGGQADGGLSRSDDRSPGQFHGVK